MTQSKNGIPFDHNLNIATNIQHTIQNGMYFDLTYLRSFLEDAIKALLVIGSIFAIAGAVLSILDFPLSTHWFFRIFLGLKYASLPIFATGLMMILLGLIGFFSMKVPNNFTVGLFAILSIVLFISVLIFSLGFVGLYLLSKNVELDSKICMKSSLFKDSFRLFQKASRYYGSKHCEAKILKKSRWAGDSGFQELDLHIDPINGYESVQECPHYDDMMEELEMTEFSSLPGKIGSLETAFQCSGICVEYPIYIFSNVNQGPPARKGGCFMAVTDSIQSVGIPFLVILWGLTCLLMMLGLNSFCLFIHPRRHDDFYIQYEPVNSEQQDQLNESNASSTGKNENTFELNIGEANKIKSRREQEDHLEEVKKNE